MWLYASRDYFWMKVQVKNYSEHFSFQ